MTALFIYRKKNHFRVLALPDDATLNQSKKLLADGYTLTASFNPVVWLEHFLNKSPEQQAEDIRYITKIRL